MATTLNMDIASIVARIRRFRYEAAKSDSGGVSAFSEHDLVRAKDFLAALTLLVDHIVNQPQLDVREKAPHTYDLGEREETGMPDNESMVDLVRQYDTMEYELIHSNSSRQATGLNEHDLRRIRAAIDKMQNFLSDYVANALPLDLGESVPFRSTTGQGRTGV